MGVNLPGAGPLGSLWRPQLSAVLPETVGRGLIVDCRSSTYAGAWTPSPELASRWVQVRVPGASHMAKHTRGLVARHRHLPPCLTGSAGTCLRPGAGRGRVGGPDAHLLSSSLGKRHGHGGAELETGLQGPAVGLADDGEVLSDRTPPQTGGHRLD